MFKNKKIPLLEYIPVLIIAFIVFKVINNIELIATGFSFLLSVLSPFIWAFGIAFFLNPLMVYFEKKFKLKRVFSIILTYIVVFGFLVIIITVISPQIASSISELVTKLPDYIYQTEHYLNSHMPKIKISDNNSIMAYINTHFSNPMMSISNYLSHSFTGLLNKTVHFSYSFFKMIFGVLISVYMLKDKELFVKNIKKIFYAILSSKQATTIVNLGKEANVIFGQFIIGKSIDSLIIGCICFIGLLIFNFKYALLISILVGITNMIPYFGPFLGMIPAGLLTLFYSPIRAFWIIVFIFLLQQFDGLFLGPKILGGKVGLSPFWVIVAITLGGGIAGVLGMFLGVPTLAVIKTLLERLINKKLKNKQLNVIKDK